MSLVDPEIQIQIFKYRVEEDMVFYLSIPSWSYAPDSQPPDIAAPGTGQGRDTQYLGL